MRPGLTPIAELNEDYEGLKVKVSGRVIEVSEHSENHLFLKVKDDSGEVISVPIFARMRAELDGNIRLLDNIQVTGQIEVYNEELELLPDKASSIQVVQTPYLGLAKIDRDKLGQIVKVKGVISSQETVGNGNLLMNIKENGRELKVFIPFSVAELEAFPETQVGYSVGVSGWLQLYYDELELKLENPANMEIIEAF